MATPPAVFVQNAYKSYGQKEVLKNLNMLVPKGSIYGLLGASGCGKTTLLSCIVGRRPLKSGEINVLGGTPGMEGSGVPGPKVGYMPQDIALVGEFTVKDAIFYFGRIFNMPEEQIEERLTQLSKLLELPPNNRFIKNCSGGQQRRVSFAASMVHMPELLILDEPTVGVDPILRERIWNYLVEITSKTNMAVIITTHYIEEARQANIIGIMREGRLLAEESPSHLLATFQTEYLEEVFLALSQKQAEGKLSDIPTNNRLQFLNSNSDVSIASLDTTRGSTDILTHNNKQKKKSTKPASRGISINSKRMRALLDKNWKQFYRNVSGAFFVFMFPIIQNIVFLFAVGGEITNINLAIVNEESMSVLCNNFTRTNTAVPYDFSSCHFDNMSCRFLEYIEDPMINKIQYFSLDKALDSVRHGDVVGVLYMAENFTASLEERNEQGRNVEKEIISFSEIKVWLDMSNRQIGATLKYKLLTLFKEFQKDVFIDCNYDPKMVDFLKIKTLHGVDDDSFTDYMTPGLILTIMFFMMTIMTSQIIITDRLEGLWDRSIIAGVSSLEITLTHFILQTGIVICYTIEVLMITFVFFKIENAGSIWVLAILTFLQGLAGMSYGFWISIVSYNINMANIVTSGSFNFMILLCGLMWPLEGMPIVLRWFSKCLPFTIAIESFRNVMAKGWNLDNLDVLNGVGVSIFWIILLGIINTVLIQSKR